MKFLFFLNAFTSSSARETEEMGSRGREVVLQHYSWEREAEVLRSTYHELLKD